MPVEKPCLAPGAEARHKPSSGDPGIAQARRGKLNSRQSRGRPRLTQKSKDLGLQPTRAASLLCLEALCLWARRRQPSQHPTSNPAGPTGPAGATGSIPPRARFSRPRNWIFFPSLFEMSSGHRQPRRTYTEVHLFASALLIVTSVARGAADRARQQSARQLTLSLGRLGCVCVESA